MLIPSYIIQERMDTMKNRKKLAISITAVLALALCLGGAALAFAGITGNLAADKATPKPTARVAPSLAAAAQAPQEEALRNFAPESIKTMKRETVLTRMAEVEKEMGKGNLSQAEFEKLQNELAFLEARFLQVETSAEKRARFIEERGIDGTPLSRERELAETKEYFGETHSFYLLERVQMAKLNLLEEYLAWEETSNTDYTALSANYAELKAFFGVMRYYDIHDGAMTVTAANDICELYQSAMKMLPEAKDFSIVLDFLYASPYYQNAPLN